MKKLLFLSLFLFAAFTSFTQESYVMYETMYMKPKADMLDEFNTALTAHNKEFHATGAASVRIFYVANGPYEGQYQWVMGPLTFTDLDNRPADKSHDDDWNEVMKYMDDVSKVEYWRESKELNYDPEGSEKFEKRLTRIFDVKDGHGKEFEELLTKVMEVTEKQALPYGMSVYWNQFETNTGRDVAVVYSIDKYSIFDQEMGFVKAFDEVHGENAWNDTYKRMTENTNSLIEELRELVPELSGVK